MTFLLKTRCPACQGETCQDLLDIPAVPVYCNVLWTQNQEAMAAARGSMALKYCPQCAHVFNASFDARLTEYSPAYDNSLHYSPQFNLYAQELAARLVKTYSLKKKTLVEIGCGKGDFLMQLCEKGDNQGWGFDRSFDPDRVDEGSRQRIHFEQDFYTQTHAHRIKPDFVCCRHVLEHIAEPVRFLQELRLGFQEHSNTVLYFEVPNALFTLKDYGIWDLIYEHCAYYTLSSLSRLMLACGFDVLALSESFGGQFIYIEVRPGSGQSEAVVPEDHQPANVSRYARHFSKQYFEKVETWKKRMHEIRHAGRTAIIWGGGSKGVTFLNVLGADSGIDYVVDLNPHKQGKYVSGTGQRVVSPEFLRELRPNDVIIMNPIYESEIAGTVKALGVQATMSCV